MKSVWGERGRSSAGFVLGLAIAFFVAVMCCCTPIAVSALEGAFKKPTSLFPFVRGDSASSVCETMAGHVEAEQSLPRERYPS